MVLSFPEPPPALFLDLLFPGLERELADALGELRYMAPEEVNHFIFLFDRIEDHFSSISPA